MAGPTPNDVLLIFTLEQLYMMEYVYLIQNKKSTLKPIRFYINNLFINISI